MGSYLESNTSTPTPSATFFGTLVTCLEGMKRVGKLKLVELSPDINPDDNEASTHQHSKNLHRWERDYLILRDGLPLLALFMGYSKSGGVIRPQADRSYASEPSAAGSALQGLKGMQRGLQERLSAEMPKEDEKPKEVFKPVFREGTWTIAIRVPGAELELFEGEPMDFDGLDKAFDRLVDLLVARTPKKPVKA